MQRLHRGGRREQAALQPRSPLHQLQRLRLPRHLPHGRRGRAEAVHPRSEGHQGGRMFGRSFGRRQSTARHSTR